MSASIGVQKKNIGMEFLKRTAGIITSASGEYISEVLPVTTNTLSEAKNSISSVSSTFSNTTQAVLPKIRQLKGQITFKNIMNWYMSKEDEFGGVGLSDNELSFDIDTDATEIAEAQITEFDKSANQISKAVVESSHQMVEAQLAATANLVTTVQNQTAVISAGFDKTNETLNKILEVLTKNTATLIETNIANNKKNSNDNMIANGKFNFAEYKNIVSSNIKNSQFGMLASMLPMLSSPDMIKTMMTPESIAKMIGEGIIDKKSPNFKKNMKALDDAVSDVIMTSLIRLGESNSYTTGGGIAKLFGIDASRKNASTSRSTLELKAVPFDSVAHESITNAIPGYLRKILVAVGGEDTIYDYRSRSFRSKGAIRKDFNNTAASTGGIYGADKRIQQAMGSDRFGSMIYDLMMNDLGSKMHGSEARNTVTKFKNKEYTEDYLANVLLKGIGISDAEMKRVKQIADNLGKAVVNGAAPKVIDRAAKQNVARNSRMKQYIDNANAYGMDLSEFSDSADNDRDTILRQYGMKSKGNLSNVRIKSGNFSGVNYTNIALYEIYRKLNQGINVYQVGSDNSRTKPYPNYKDKYLQKPSLYKPIMMNDEVQAPTKRSSLVGDVSHDETNLLENQTLEDGSVEDLTRGQRLKRWGKDRGGNLLNALFSGSTEQVRDAFGLIVRDIGQVGSKAIKNKASKINAGNGNITGFLKHKLMGSEYSYVGDDGKEYTVEKNEKGGYLGYLDEVVFGPGGHKSAFKHMTSMGSKWFKSVSGYFNYGDSKEDGGVLNKRKKILSTSVGAMLGMGLLGGPLGIIMGGVAGNAIGHTDGIGSKIHKLLFGDKDHEGNKKKDRNKRRGLIGRAVDNIVDPIKYQIGKTMTKFGSVLQKNILGPLSNIGYAIKERMSNAAGGVVSKVFGKLFGGMGGILKKIIMAPFNMIKAPATIMGKMTRGGMEAGGAVVGGGLNSIAKAIAGKNGKDAIKQRIKNQKHDADIFEAESGFYGDYEFDYEQDPNGPHGKMRKTAKKVSKGRDYKSWKEKQDEARDKKITDVAEYTKETTKLTSEISKDVHDMAVEALTKGSLYTHDEGLHTRLDAIINILENNGIKNNMIGKSEYKEDTSGFGHTLIQAASTISDEGGIDNEDIKSLEDLAVSSQGNISKSSIFDKFKRILKRNKNKADYMKEKDEDEKKSFISSITDMASSVISKGLPYILGALALFNDNFREIVTDILGKAGNWLIENLPGIISGVSSVGAAVNQAIENNASGASMVVDPVTNELKSVISAETHAKKVENGTISSAIDSSSNLGARFKDNMIMSGERAIIRLGSNIVATGASGVGGLANIVNLGSKAFQSAGSFIQGISQNGFTKLGFAKGAEFAGRTWALGGSNVAQSTANVASNVSKGARDVSSMMRGIKSSVKGAFNNPKNIASTVGSIANVIGGAASNFAASVGWDSTETSKHYNIIGNYGLGSAGGYAQTNTTAKTVTTTSIGMAGGIAIGAACKTAAAALASAGTVNGWNPVGWACLIIAGVIALSALLASLSNWIVGLVVDESNKDYSIRSNSAKLSKVIKDGQINYTAGNDNPMYVYCAQESDRTIGLTDGMYIKDPEYVFGKYLKAIADGAGTSPGAIVLLYDLLNNMAVQGVPFACIKAGDSDECNIKGKHANTTSTDGPSESRTGPVGGKYCQVLKSQVRRNKEIVFADIWRNVERQDKDCTWSYESLEIVWDEGKEVVKELKNNSILKNNGEVDTKQFKGKPNSGKNDAGWTSLYKLCKKHDLYFLTKCLVYINSKIEADKNGKQWLELHQDDLVALMESLKDVLMKQSKSVIDEMKASGMTDEEINKSLADSINPKSDKATAAGALAKNDSTYNNISKSGIRDKDKQDVAKELKLITASYAYSHPDILQQWVSKHTTAETGVSIDNVSNISKWKTAFTDKTKSQILKSEMATAARRFAETQGDIFGLTSLFDWREGGSIYTGKSSDPGEKYGSGFIFRGKKTKSGKGVLDSLWNGLEPIEKNNTPEDIHKELFGKKEHGKASEASSTNDMDMTVGGSGIFAKIAEFAGKYGSTEFKDFMGDKIGKWKEVLLNIPTSHPKNLAVGGPEETNESEDKKTANISSSEGGNPLNKSYRVTSQYGPRTYPHSGFHKGVDLVPANNDGSLTDVGSRFNGTILSVKSNVSDSDTAVKVGGSWKYNGANSTGNMVTIKTDDGLIIKNMHLKAGSIPSNIVPGAKINVGDKIGTMGSTGWSTGPHLHYQIEDASGQHIDPMSFMDGNTISSFKQGSDTTYPANETYSSSTTSSDEGTSDSGGKLSNFLSSLKDLGNKFLYAITGGILGSNTEDSESTMNGMSTHSVEVNGDGSNTLATRPNSKWVEIVRKIKKAIAKKIISYNKQGSVDLNVDGTNLNVRTDCTGIIAAMLKLYGSLPMNGNVNSTTLLSDGAIKSGFTKSTFPGWDRLVEGDILVKSGHAEIFAYNEGNNHFVYNGGSTPALRSEGATKSGTDGYKVIWRCNETKAIGDAINSTVNSISNVSTVKSNNEQEVWDYLNKLNYTDIAKAGIMGTWAEETHNKANTIEGYYLPQFPGFEKVLASNKALNDYTLNTLFHAYAKSGISIRKDAYVAEDGNYYPGIGIAQWTGPRGLKLFNHAKSKGMDWRNLDGQMEFFNEEMMSKSRGISPTDINAATSPEYAAKIFANKYEGTYNQSLVSDRQKQAGRIFATYANATPTDGMGGGEDAAHNASLGTSRFGKKAVSVGNRNNNISNRISTRMRTALPGQAIDIPSEGGRTSDESIRRIQELLMAVVTELRTISSNTGASNSLLGSLNSKEFVDTGLRESLSQRSTHKSKSTSYRNSSGTNARAVAALARP